MHDNKIKIDENTTVDCDFFIENIADNIFLTVASLRDHFVSKGNDPNYTNMVFLTIMYIVLGRAIIAAVTDGKSREVHEKIMEDLRAKLLDLISTYLERE